MLVELSVYATELKNVAGAFKGTSDPFAVVTNVATRPATVLGKTEVIKNTLDPQWVKTFSFNYELGDPMKIAVNIFDEVRKGDNKGMGVAVFEVGKVLAARGSTMAKKLRQGGQVFARIVKSTGSGVLHLKMKASNLKNVEGFFSKSDPFYELEREVDAAGAQTWDNVYRSAWIKNNLNPDWELAKIPMSSLCGGDLNTNIKIAVYDHEKSGDHTPMGSVQLKVKEFIEKADGSTPLTLQTKGKEVGTLFIQKAQIVGMDSTDAAATTTGNTETAGSGLAGQMASMNIASAPSSQPSFLDYVAGGCELNVVVAVDYTGSNGNPRQPGTLHYMNPPGSFQKNDYEKAMSAILDILQQYDHDKKFPVLGFGAKYNGIINHCFQCGPTEEAVGVDGVLAAYRQVFSSGLVMSSPTVFTEVIQTAAARANSSLQLAQSMGKQTYTILLIVTDGAVSDPQATAACLGQIKDSPLSIVIVGVGDADFSTMEFLDNVGNALGRDMVQFVQMNRVRSSSELTHQTLQEIPGQLVQFFQRRGIPPLPPVAAGEGDIVVEEEEEEIDLSMNINDDEIVVTAFNPHQQQGAW